MGQVDNSYCDNGLHRGQGEVCTEILDQEETSTVTMGQVEISTETMGYTEERERLVLGS